jgi:hypothetical protein
LPSLVNRMAQRCDPCSSGGGNYIEAMAQGGVYTFGLPFSPDQFALDGGKGFDQSVEKHTTSNLAQFFIGGANVTVTPVSTTSIDVSITNATSRSSLGLHIIDNFTNQSIYNDQRTPLSNIKQTIIFRIININPNKLMVDPLQGQAVDDKAKIKKLENTA